MVGAVEAQAEAGLIDDPSNIAKQRVYLFSGKSDYTVQQSVTVATKDAYVELGASVAFDFDLSAGHGWPSDLATASCGSSLSPYFVNCDDFDGAGAFLKHSLPQAGPYTARGTAKSSRLRKFEQASFVPSEATLSDAELDEYG